MQIWLSHAAGRFSSRVNEELSWYDFAGRFSYGGDKHTNQDTSALSGQQTMILSRKVIEELSPRFRADAQADARPGVIRFGDGCRRREKATITGNNDTTVHGIGLMNLGKPGIRVFMLT